MNPRSPEERRLEVLASKYGVDLNNAIGSNQYNPADVYNYLNELDRLSSEYGDKFDVLSSAKKGYALKDISNYLSGQEKNKWMRSTVGEGLKGVVRLSKAPFTIVHQVENMGPAIAALPQRTLGAITGNQHLKNQADKIYNTGKDIVDNSFHMDDYIEKQVQRLETEAPNYFSNPHQNKTLDQKMKNASWYSSAVMGALPSLASFALLSGPKAVKFAWAAGMEGASALDSINEYERSTGIEIPVWKKTTLGLTVGLFNGLLEEAGAATALGKKSIMNVLMKEITRAGTAGDVVTGIKRAAGEIFTNSAQREAATKGILDVLSRSRWGASFKAGIGEAATEGIQNTSSNLADKSYNPETSMTQGLAESVVGGFIPGAGLRYATGKGDYLNAPSPEQIADLTEKYQAVNQADTTGKGIPVSKAEASSSESGSQEVSTSSPKNILRQPNESVTQEQPAKISTGEPEGNRTTTGPPIEVSPSPDTIIQEKQTVKELPPEPPKTDLNAAVEAKKVEGKPEDVAIKEVLAEQVAKTLPTIKEEAPPPNEEKKSTQVETPTTPIETPKEPEAIEYLKKRGFTDEQINRLSPEAVAKLYGDSKKTEFADELTKDKGPLPRNVFIQLSNLGLPVNAEYVKGVTTKSMPGGKVHYTLRYLWLKPEYGGLKTKPSSAYVHVYVDKKTGKASLGPIYTPGRDTAISLKEFRDRYSDIVFGPERQQYNENRKDEDLNKRTNREDRDEYFGNDSNTLPGLNEDATVGKGMAEVDKTNPQVTSTGTENTDPAYWEQRLREKEQQEKAPPEEVKTPKPEGYNEAENWVYDLITDKNKMEILLDKTKGGKLTAVGKAIEDLKERWKKTGSDLSIDEWLVDVISKDKKLIAGIKTKLKKSGFQERMPDEMVGPLQPGQKRYSTGRYTDGYTPDKPIGPEFVRQVRKVEGDKVTIIGGPKDAGTYGTKGDHIHDVIPDPESHGEAVWLGYSLGSRNNPKGPKIFMRFTISEDPKTREKTYTSTDEKAKYIPEWGAAEPGSAPEVFTERIKAAPEVSAQRWIDTFKFQSSEYQRENGLYEKPAYEAFKEAMDKNLREENIDIPKTSEPPYIHKGVKPPPIEEAPPTGSGSAKYDKIIAAERKINERKQKKEASLVSPEIQKKNPEEAQEVSEGLEAIDKQESSPKVAEEPAAYAGKVVVIPASSALNADLDTHIASGVDKGMGTSDMGTAKAIVDEAGVVTKILDVDGTASNKHKAQAAFDARVHMTQEKKTEKERASVIFASDIDADKAFEAMYEADKNQHGARTAEIDSMAGKTVAEKTRAYVGNKFRSTLKSEFLKEDGGVSDRMLWAFRDVLGEPFNLRKQGGKEDSHLTRSEIYKMFEAIYGPSPVEVGRKAKASLWEWLSWIAKPFGTKGGKYGVDEHGNMTVTPPLRLLIGNFMTAGKAYVDMFNDNLTNERHKRVSEIASNPSQNGEFDAQVIRNTFHESLSKIKGLNQSAFWVKNKHLANKLLNEYAEKFGPRDFLKNATEEHDRIVATADVRANMAANINRLKNIIEEAGSTDEDVRPVVVEALKEIKRENDLARESLMEKIDALAEEKEIISASGKYTPREIIASLKNLDMQQSELGRAIIEQADIHEKLRNLARDVSRNINKNNILEVIKNLQYASEANMKAAERHMSAVGHGRPNIGGKEWEYFDGELKKFEADFEKKYGAGSFKKFSEAADNFFISLNEARYKLLVESGVYAEDALEMHKKNPRYYRVHWKAKESGTNPNIIFSRSPVIDKRISDQGLAISPSESAIDSLLSAYRTVQRQKAAEALESAIIQANSENAWGFKTKYGIPFGIVSAKEAAALENDPNYGTIPIFKRGSMYFIKVPKLAAKAFYNQTTLEMLRGMAPIFRNTSTWFAATKTIYDTFFLAKNVSLDYLRGMLVSQGGITSGKDPSRIIQEAFWTFPDIPFSLMAALELQGGLEMGKPHWQWMDKIKINRLQMHREAAKKLLEGGAYNSFATMLFHEAKTQQEYMPTEFNRSTVKRYLANAILATKYIAMVTEPGAKIFTGTRHYNYLKGKGYSEEKIKEIMSTEARIYGGTPSLSQTGAIPRGLKGMGAVFLTPTIQGVSKDVTRLVDPAIMALKGEKNVENWKNSLSVYANLSILAVGLKAISDWYFSDDDEGKKRLKDYVETMSSQEMSKTIPLPFDSNLSGDTFETYDGRKIRELKGMKGRDILQMMWSLINMPKLQKYEELSNQKGIAKDTVMQALNDWFWLPVVASDSTLTQKVVQKFQPAGSIYKAATGVDPYFGNKWTPKDLEQRPNSQRIVKSKGKDGVTITPAHHIAWSKWLFQFANALGLQDELEHGWIGNMMSPNGLDNILGDWIPYERDISRTSKVPYKGRDKAANMPFVGTFYRSAYRGEKEKIPKIREKMANERGFTPQEEHLEKEEKFLEAMRSKFPNFSVFDSSITEKAKFEYLVEKEFGKDMKNRSTAKFYAKTLMGKLDPDESTPYLYEIKNYNPMFRHNWETINEFLTADLAAWRDEGKIDSKEIIRRYQPLYDHKKIPYAAWIYVKENADAIAADPEFSFEIPDETWGKEKKWTPYSYQKRPKQIIGVSKRTGKVWMNLK